MANKKRVNLRNADIYVTQLPDKLFPEEFLLNNNPLYCISVNNEFLRTPSGTVIFHEDERAMNELAAELEFTDKLDANKISLYSILSTQIEFEREWIFSKENVIPLIVEDAFFYPCAGPEVIDQLKYLGIVSDYLTDQDPKIRYPYSFQTFDNGTCQSCDGCEKFISDENCPKKQLFDDENFQRVTDVFVKKLGTLNKQQRTVFVNVVSVYHSATLGLMLADQKMTPQEFSIAYLMANNINSKVWSGEKGARSEEIAFLEAVKKDADCLLRYLNQFSPRLSPLEQLIKNGKTKHVEFKSTLSKNLVTGQEDPEIEHAALKEIVGFLNTDGGT
jgi:hypothetical protein